MARSPYLEVYWESWCMRRSADYASELTGVSYGPVGSGEHPNIVNLAFGNFTFTEDEDGQLNIGKINDQICRDGQRYSPARLRQDIDIIHSQGGMVKVSFGGGKAPMHNFISTHEQAVDFSSNAIRAVQQFNLDGIDLDFEDRESNPDLQVEIVNLLRAGLPNEIITLTVPAVCFNKQPYRQFLPLTASLVSAVNVMAYDIFWSGYDAMTDFHEFNQLGLPMSKLVWGVMPGFSDCKSEFTSETDAEMIANQVKSNGFAGVMMWSLNRDTDHRSVTSLRQFQTNLPDGTFTRLFANILASP